MKNYFSISLLFFLCSFGSIWAQTGQIKGSVTSINNKPIVYANIMVSGTDQGTETDTNGKYSIQGVAPGKYTLVFSSVGYGTINKAVLVRPGKVSTINVVLQEEQQQLSEVVVEGHQNKYVSKKPSSSLRLKTEVAKLPQNVQIIGGELLKDQQVTSIMDGVTRNVSGITMLEHWGHFARINMRGFRLPAFRNGVNVQDTWGPLSEDMNTVERVEFVKGPAGFMMSAGEPGGFYNVVTKKPTENFIANASFMGGSFDFYRGTVDVSGKLSSNGKLLGRFNAMYQTNDTHRGDESVTRYGIAPSLTYKLSDNTRVTAEMNLQQAESYIGSAYVFAPPSVGFGGLDRNFKPTNNDYPVTDIQEVTFFLNMSHKFSDNWSVEGQLAYLKYDQKGNSTWVFDPDGSQGPLSAVNENGDVYRYTNKWDALSVGKYGQIYIHGNFNTGSISHKVMGGFDFSEKSYWADFSGFSPIDTTTPFNIFNPVYGESPATNFDRSIPIRNRSVLPYAANTTRAYYAQDEVGFMGDKIRLTLAGRYTNLYTQGKSETDNVVTPRIGLSADITSNVAVYALFDQSFLAQSGISSSGEALNDPVEAKDIEGGFKMSFFDGALKTSLGVYKINKSRILVGDPAFPGQNFSIYSGELESKGIEFDAQGQITPEFNVIFNYANSNVEDKSGALQAGFAKHVTNGWFNYDFAHTSNFKGFGASLGYQYQVDRSSWTLAADNQPLLPNYFRLDGALSWKNEHLRVQLSVNNILDEYLYSGAAFGNYVYWQSEPGINGRIGVTYTF